MAETTNRFLNIVLAEGIVVTALGVLMLLLPQITSFATAMVISIVLMVYGIYKFFNSIAIRKEIDHAWLGMLIGLALFGIGLYLTLNPTFNLIILTTLLGVYFLLESINTTAYAFQTKGVLKYWWLNLLIAVLQFALALVILLGLPLTALWVIGVLLGINFLFTGMAMISLFITTRYLKNDLSRI